MTKTSFTYKLSAEQQSALCALLRTGNYKPLPGVEHSLMAAATSDCRIVLYKSGKCLVQGKGAGAFVEFAFEPEVLNQAGLGYEHILNPEMCTPHMGVDESGKGDFFGPLAVVSAFTDKTSADKLAAMGVRDSKSISSDKKALQMAEDIRKLLHGQYNTVLIGPTAYNKLYAKMRNVNRILAWAHARTIENLLALIPSCPRAVSDQFGNKALVKRALMSKGRSIELVQMHRAESDIAVAAASILARAAFLNGLNKMASDLETPLSKGASDKVILDGCELIKKHGPGSLLDTAKCHFKTTDAIMKACNIDRSVLGPIGSVTSLPSGTRLRLNDGVKKKA